MIAMMEKIVPRPRQCPEHGLHAKQIKQVAVVAANGFGEGLILGPLDTLQADKIY
jgi:hypothetical protein